MLGGYWIICEKHKAAIHEYKCFTVYFNILFSIVSDIIHEKCRPSNSFEC